MHLTTDLWGMVGRADDSIITEIKDRQSLQLLRVAGISHFVISDELISMMTVHLARNPSLHHFWIDHVFSNGSSEFAIVPVNRYNRLYALISPCFTKHTRGWMLPCGSLYLIVLLIVGTASLRRDH